MLKKQKIKWIIHLLSTLLFLNSLTGCAAPADKKSTGPTDWAVYAVTPKYSPTFVEGIRIANTEGHIYQPPTSLYPDSSDSPYGWSGSMGYASSRVTSSSLPQEISVLWMPLSTQITYVTTFTVSQKVRDAMKVRHYKKCGYGKLKLVYPYNNQLLLGLAPDGTVKVFLNGSCDPKKLVMTIHSKPTTKFDNLTKNNTNEELKDFPEAYAWIKKHGVPKGPW